MKAARLTSTSFLLLVVLLACACSSVLVHQGAVQYRAFGDSITAGKTLSDPGSQAYPDLVGTDRRTMVYNYAREGDQACDLAPSQIFPNGESPTLALHPAYSILIGTGDVDAHGTGAHERIFTECLAAAITWLAVPVEQKLLVGGEGFLAAGPGMIDESDGWRAWTTQGQASTVSFTITTTAIGPIYVWRLMDDGSPASYSYALDGKVLGNAAVRPDARMDTAETKRSVGLLRLPQVAAGNHVVTVTQTSSGKDGVSVIGVSAPGKVGSGSSPVVLVGTIPLQLHTGSDSGCQATDDPCLAYNTDIEDVVDELSTDGLDVRLFDTRKYMHGTSAEMSDAIHPNARGQKELRQAIEAIWTAGK